MIFTYSKNISNEVKTLALFLAAGSNLVLHVDINIPLVLFIY